ncbi:hypothetical protein DFH08DRAFT_962721 [Mycena albidolilacea]|uniref:Uncharacterized protein n=1 Tax=Mycena albidolilacea TaxID=1033008 RepID=A0AAD7ENY1_9AGAR|nr:hypothetical protein DFH08DRAFT_962721 [Mycena albidolilacea]
MSPAFPVMRFTALTGGLLGIGYLLLQATVSATAKNEEEAYKRLTPFERQRVDAARAHRLAQEAEIREKVFARKPINPDDYKPVWGDETSKK